MKLLGLGVALVALVALLACTLLLYFHVRKKHAGSKFLVEFLFILVAFLINIGVKIVVELIADPPLDRSMWAWVSKMLYAAYSSFGTLGFGGLPYSAASVPGGYIFATLYYGSSIYVALIMLTVISARASYEFYSYFRLIFTCKRNKNIYVFTALTEESITFAESIKEECEKKKKKAMIVFGGPGLKTFDRKDELCRRVVADGFCYWSYSSAKGKSIAKALHLKNNNKNFTDVNDKRDFMIFAFASNDHIPEEENNLTAVLDDIKIRKKKKDKLFIEYFVLTKRKINYQAYQKALEEAKKATDEEKRQEITIKAKPKNEAKKSEGENGKPVDEFATLTIFNEAYEGGQTSVQKILDKDMMEKLSSDEMRPVSVWSLGFGGTGEAISKELFVQTPGIAMEENAGVVTKTTSRPFAVNVFDARMTEAGELFRAEHPENYDFLDDPAWGDLLKKAIASANQAAGLPCPVYGFHQFRGEDAELYNMKGDILSENAPDVITIATGDDYRNITYANVIGQWIVNANAPIVAPPENNDKRDGKEVTPEPPTVTPHKYYLVVAIFNKNNNNLLSTYGVPLDEERREIEVGNYLKIIIVNNLDEVYSFKNYSERKISAIKKHTTYNSLTGNKFDLWSSFKEISEEKDFDTIRRSGHAFEVKLEKLVQENAKTSDASDFVDGSNELSEKADFVLKRINALFENAENDALKKESILEYEQSSLWEKASNQSVVSAEKYYRYYFWKTIVTILSKCALYGRFDLAKEMRSFKRLAIATEHDRWVRLHFAEGWVYRVEKNKEKKQHDCLQGYSLTASSNGGTLCYDLANVLWALYGYDPNAEGQKESETSKGKETKQSAEETQKAEEQKTAEEVQKSEEKKA